MITTITINQQVNDFALLSMSWSDLNQIMMSLVTTKKILEKRLNENPANPNTMGQIKMIQEMIKTIDLQYPNWKGNAISLLDNSISETLNDHDIHSNRITIL